MFCLCHAQLFTGELLGVTATSALELGVDVGCLDSTIILGFPGSIASLWQQVVALGFISRSLAWALSSM